jgi:2',3'-cyclic-nucleotide 2'-phosphodiesterase (5'-nucleotidase family)
VARRATVIKEKLERESAHLIVDAGHFTQGAGSDNDVKAKYMVKAMHLMGYDAINLGQEETALGPELIQDFRERERIPLVSTNLFRREGGRSLVSPYLIKRLGASRFLGFEYGGIKVAILGLASEAFRNPKVQQIPEALTVGNPEATLQALVGKMRKHADLVVVLSDLRPQEAVALAQKVDGIDLFFIGKGAKGRHAEETVGTIFVCPAARGAELGDIELILDDHNRVVSSQLEWTRLDKNVASDEAMDQLVAEYKAALQGQKSTQKGCGE